MNQDPRSEEKKEKENTKSKQIGDRKLLLRVTGSRDGLTTGCDSHKEE